MRQETSNRAEIIDGAQELSHLQTRRSTPQKQLGFKAVIAPLSPKDPLERGRSRLRGIFPALTRRRDIELEPGTRQNVLLAARSRRAVLWMGIPLTVLSFDRAPQGGRRQRARIEPQDLAHFIERPFLPAESPEGAGQVVVRIGPRGEKLRRILELVHRCLERIRRLDSTLFQGGKPSPPLIRVWATDKSGRFGSYFA